MNVVVVGSVNLDAIMRTPHLPAPGETVIGATLTLRQGGKGANAAVAAARLGAPTALVAAIGDDAAGASARADLTGNGVDVSAVSVVDAPTGAAHIALDVAGENTIVVASGANARLDADVVTRALERLAGPSTVVLADLELPEEAIAAAAAACVALGARFVLDPGPARPLPDAVIAACEALTPNQGELAALGGSAEALLGRGARSVVVTRGPAGAVLHEPGRPPHEQPSPPVDAVDSTGAGDAFAAGFAVALARGEGRREAVRFAAAAGALATCALGARAALASTDEVDALLGLTL
jgi:ribokinase